MEVLDATGALAAAARLAEEFATGAALRDRERILAFEQLHRLALSGLLAITVPHAFGGPGLPASVVAEVVRRISWAAPSIGQIPLDVDVFEAVQIIGIINATNRITLALGVLPDREIFAPARPEDG